MTKEIFREGELTAVSLSDYKILCDHGFLVEIYEDPEKITYYVGRIAYKVRKEGNDFYGYRISGDGDAVIKLKRADTKYVRFELKKFIQLLKTKNGLAGNSNVLTNRISFVGRHEALDSSVNVALGLFCDDRSAGKELLALPSRLTKADKTVVLCPTYSAESMDFSKILEDKNIHCYELEKILNDTFQIDFSLISNNDETKIFHIPAIKQNEKAGYKSHDYKRKDIIEFMQEEAGNRLIRLKINGNPPVDIRYSEVALLMLMAIRLKENNGGWVSFNDVLKDEIIHCDHDVLPNKKDADDLARFHRLVSDVRKIFSRFQCKDLIEGVRGKSQYRISTHPSRIKDPGSNWLKRTYKNTILPALKASRNGKNE